MVAFAAVQLAAQQQPVPTVVADVAGDIAISVDKAIDLQNKARDIQIKSQPRRFTGHTDGDALSWSSMAASWAGAVQFVRDEIAHERVPVAYRIVTERTRIMLLKAHLDRAPLDKLTALIAARPTATADELLAELKLVYAHNDEKLARMEISRLTQRDDESVSSYHARFEALKQRDPGQDDKARLERFIAGLIPSLNSQIEKTMAIPGTSEWSDAQVFAYLKHIEAADAPFATRPAAASAGTKTTSTRSRPSAAASGVTHSTPSSPRVGKRSNTHQLASPRSQVYCSFCNRPGHSYDDCRTRTLHCTYCSKSGHIAEKCYTKRRDEGTDRGGNDGAPPGQPADISGSYFEQPTTTLN